MIEYIVIAKSCDVIGTSIVQGKDFLKEISFQEEANATKSFFLSFFIGRFGPLTTNWFICECLSVYSSTFGGAK